jgi:hypothetical protein
MTLEEAEIEYAPYLVDATIQEGGESVVVKVAHAWLEVNDAHLSANIPAARILQQWRLVSDSVTLATFALRIDNLNGPTSLLMLSARDFDSGRKKHTTALDLHDWVTEVLPFGYTADDILTDSQAALIIEEKGLVA